MTPTQRTSSRPANPQDGWKELGDILLALRAHDERIEDRLAELMTLYLPPEPEGGQDHTGDSPRRNEADELLGTRRQTRGSRTGSQGSAGRDEEARRRVCQGVGTTRAQGNYGSWRRIPDRDGGQADRAKSDPQRQEQGKRRNRAPHGRCGKRKTGREDRDAGKRWTSTRRKAGSRTWPGEREARW